MHEDPTKHLQTYVSFDPAIDQDAMGERFVEHFGRCGSLTSARSGTRNPADVRLFAGKRAGVFTLRPLTLAERFDCDAVVSVEHRLARALGYALVKAELHAPLAVTSTIVHARDAVPGFTLDMLTGLMELIGVEAIYEIGMVAYTRSRLGPFDAAFAPLPLTSAQRLLTLDLRRADTLEREKSATRSTGAASSSQPGTSAPSAQPGAATAPESAGPSSEATPPTSE